jgi:hypothetical protein
VAQQSPQPLYEIAFVIGPLLASLEVCLLSAIIVLVGQESEIRINPYEFGA